MALKIWLPLNGTLENKGVSDFTITNNGATIDNNGKIGKCYYFNGSTYISGSGINYTSLSTHFSVSLWIKFHEIISSYSEILSLAPTAGWAKIRFGMVVPSNSTVISCSVADGTNYLGNSFQTSSIPLDTWTHVCFIYNNKNLELYIDGNFLKSYSTSIVPDWENISTIGIGAAANGQEKSKCYINDVRIYDHALSAKEVKEISQGLILHYKLDNPYSSDNLIENGYGENGTTNWTNSYRSTTEIPSGHPEIKASFYGGNMTVNYIPVISSHSYTISGYIKSSGATSGTTYPSIYPYDIDKNFIYNRNSRIGFNLTTATTLTQPLKPGDTVIYVADLSKWNSNSGHYYNYCAIFGYEDSTGYVYPDFEYTRDLGRFGSSTNEKSNLDKQNNKITLISAYDGSFHPAGTAVCASTDGSTYYYPFGGIALSSLSDWVFKTATFIPQNDDRLRWSRYLQWSTYGNCYIAGNKLIDNTFISDTIKDSSGYENDGTVLGNSYINSDANRYQISTYFDGVDDGILIENLTLSSIINDQVSYSFWIKPEGENGGRSVYFGSFSSTSWSIEKTANNVLRLYWNGSPDEICSGATITDGIWQHIVITKKGTNDIKVYINGVQKWTSTAAHNTLSFPTTYRIGRDTRSGDGTPYHGLMSDFRIYTTALSSDDVLDLYHTSANIDNLGGIHGFEFEEKTPNLLNPDLREWSKESNVTCVWNEETKYFDVNTNRDTSITSRWGIFQNITVKPNTSYLFAVDMMGTGSAMGIAAQDTTTAWPSDRNTAGDTKRYYYILTTTATNTVGRVYLDIKPSINQIAHFKNIYLGEVGEIASIKQNGIFENEDIVEYNENGRITKSGELAGSNFIEK